MKTKSQHYVCKMQAGERLGRNPNEPILSLLRDGKNSYLWVGNDADDDKVCFATLAGPARLRNLARAILEEVGDA